MGDVITPIVALPGFFAGMFLWAQCTRWVGLLYVSVSKDGGDFLGPRKRRLLWAVPFLALLHPAPWLTGAAVLFAFRTFRGDAAPGWSWFFGGLALALLFMLLGTLTVIVRWRHLRKLQANGPDKSLEQKPGK
jgi:hypothetical protein